MSTPFFQHIDALAKISKRYADDAALPLSSRERFLCSYYLASALKHFSGIHGAGHLGHAFHTMCEACKKAELHRCEPQEASFRCCRLVVNHAA